MSADLVARLRKLAGYLRQHHSEPTVPGVAMSEAADRIEALEAALAKAERERDEEHKQQGLWRNSFNSAKDDANHHATKRYAAEAALAKLEGVIAAVVDDVSERTKAGMSWGLHGHPTMSPKSMFLLTSARAATPETES